MELRWGNQKVEFEKTSDKSAFVAYDRRKNRILIRPGLVGGCNAVVGNIRGFGDDAQGALDDLHARMQLPGVDLEAVLDFSRTAVDSKERHMEKDEDSDCVDKYYVTVPHCGPPPNEAEEVEGEERLREVIGKLLVEGRRLSDIVVEFERYRVVMVKERHVIDVTRILY